MFSFGLRRLISRWQRLSKLDRVALFLVLLYCLVWLLRTTGQQAPFGRFVGFLFFIALAYFLFRLLGWSRRHLLWSLRNRLIVAYLFIAVVPVLLLLSMALLSAYIIYSQLGAYLLYDEFQRRIEGVKETAGAVAATMAAEAGSAAIPSQIPPSVAALIAAQKMSSLGMEIQPNTGQNILERISGSKAEEFSGIAYADERLTLVAVASRPITGGRVFVTASLPVTTDLLEGMAPYLGPIQLVTTRPADSRREQGVVYRIGDRTFRPAGQVSTRRRTFQPAAHWLDYEIRGGSKLEAVALDSSAGKFASSPVFVFFSARPSQLNRRLFSSLGELGELPFQILIAIGVIFLVLEVAALVTGIVLTRTITQAVSDLYSATQHVQGGDLSYRVRIPRQDQLGVLGDSFNSMTSSISTLIEEQRQRQRLENELAIAREVQAQLFPRSIPSVPGMQLEAICRAARMVSGDYYDFIGVMPGQVVMVLSDISGKGISAALLMASLQAALRSQVQLDGRVFENTADLVSRLNRHLFLNTSDDRYATLFYGVYDDQSRMLHYTNAGHLPPLYVTRGSVRKLETGGTVIGLFDDCVYEQGSLAIESGSFLVAYSDGLIEPENVYGEQFGIQRMTKVILENCQATPGVLATTLMSAVDEWAGAPEQADDMTLIIARWD